MSGPGTALSAVGAAREEQAGAIKDLFRRNGWAGFDRIHDQVYPAVGAVRWVAEDAAGAVVMHVALFPGVFEDGRREWRVGLLGDLMADPEHRTFFGPVQLLRGIVAHAAAAGLDLLYSDPTPVSAGVLRAAGFEALGALRRYVMPTAAPWRLVGALRGVRALAVTAVRPLDDDAVHDLLPRLGSAGTMRARRSRAAYRYRSGTAADESRWLRMEAGGRPAALALVRHDAAEGRALIADLVTDGAPASLAGALLAAGRWARREGANRVDLQALEGSAAALAARRVGYLAREDTQPVVLRVLGDAPPPPAQWFLGRLDGSAW